MLASMVHMTPLEQDRSEFIRRSGRFLAFPLAGALVWGAVGFASLFLSTRTGLFVLVFASGAIFPLALGFARLLGQEVFIKNNRFATLIGLCVLMVNLLWVLHFILVLRLPSVAPLSIAIALGLHWIVFGWILGHSLGLTHTLLRTVLCTAASLLLPSYPIAGVAAAVVLSYLITVGQLVRFFAAPGNTPS